MQRLPAPRWEDFALRATNPRLGGGGTTYDLVEEMQYLYVHVVKAENLPARDTSRDCSLYVEVKLGNYKGTTRHIVTNAGNPDWNQVFSFSTEQVQETQQVEIFVKDRNLVQDGFVGRVQFDLDDVPKRVEHDSQLAPKWYGMANQQNGEQIEGAKLALAVWMGTQADEAFPEAWKWPEADDVPSESLASIRTKVYSSPKLWYLTINVINAVNIPRNCSELSAKLTLGSQTRQTHVSELRHDIHWWNEVLMFVIAEPIQSADNLWVSVQDGDDLIGKTAVSLRTVDRRSDGTAVNARWWHLIRRTDTAEDEEFDGLICLRICLDGRYHVSDELTHYSSDLRPTAKQFWTRSIAQLQLGILSAEGLKTENGKGAVDAYCVAKYGRKWVRTRTVIDSSMPRWNEQYTWDVYDPCTVITVGVFDNCHFHMLDDIARDTLIGKVRIRLSTLETNKVYCHSYPLPLFLPGGLKKMGEIQLAVRLISHSSSLINLMHIYSRSLLPKMHHLHPFSDTLRDSLRQDATQIIARDLSRAEPPLRKEVVEYMLDVGTHQMCSMRKDKVNFCRFMKVLNGLVAAVRWFDQICNWRNPFWTVLIHVLFVFWIFYPQWVLPHFFLGLFLIAVWNYVWNWPKKPSDIDIQLFFALTSGTDELDAGLDYKTLGDLATQGERAWSLLSWTDPRASSLFLLFCFLAGPLLWVIPVRVVSLLSVFYIMRHPRFRHKLPFVPLNFIKRLPTRSVMTYDRLGYSGLDHEI